MTDMLPLDEKDRKILDELVRDGKATTGAIAKRCAIPVTTVHNRIKRFERSGLVKNYSPVLDHHKLGLEIFALIFLTVEGKVPGSKAVDQQELAKMALKIAGIENVRILTGSFDLLLEARVKNVDALNRLLVKELRKLPGVDKTQTMLVLEEITKR